MKQFLTTTFLILAAVCMMLPSVGASGNGSLIISAVQTCNLHTIPLPDATVTIVGNGFTASMQTDAGGYALFANVPAPVYYTAFVSKAGYWLDSVAQSGVLVDVNATGFGLFTFNAIANGDSLCPT